MLWTHVLWLMCLMMVWWLRTCFKLLYLYVSTIFAMWLPYLRPYLSSSRIHEAALGHTWTPFCFVIRQLLGFFPGQVHQSAVSFDDVHLVLPRSSRFSLVTSQFPLCCLTSCSRVAHSQDVSQPSEPSFFNHIFFQFPWTSFLSDVFISDLVPSCNPQQSPLEFMVSCF